MYQESEPGDILATFEASAYRCFLFRFPFCPIASFVCRKAKAAAYARFQRKVMAIFRQAACIGAVQLSRHMEGGV